MDGTESPACKLASTCTGMLRLSLAIAGFVVLAQQGIGNQTFLALTSVWAGLNGIQLIMCIGMGMMAPALDPSAGEYGDMAWSLWKEATSYVFLVAMIQLGMTHAGTAMDDGGRAMGILLGVLGGMYLLQVWLLFFNEHPKTVMVCFIKLPSRNKGRVRA